MQYPEVLLVLLIHVFYVQGLPLTHVRWHRHLAEEHMVESKSRPGVTTDHETVLSDAHTMRRRQDPVEDGWCYHLGRYIKDGQLIWSADGCNACTCFDGQLACTDLNCDNIAPEVFP